MPAASHTLMATRLTARTCPTLAPPFSAPRRWPLSCGLTYISGFALASVSLGAWARPIRFTRCEAITRLLA